MSTRRGPSPIAFVVLCVLLATAGISTLSAQTVTGSITGMVTDPKGAVIPGVSVTLTSDNTGAARTEVTDQRGEFTFNALQPDKYTLTAEHSGFKKYEKKNLVLNPSDHLSAGQLPLQIGQATESVQVIAEGATVQTASSERSGVITSEQVQDLTVINRDFSVLASLQPGVVYNPGAEAQSFSSSSSFNVNGARSGQNNITIDGVPVENSNGASINSFISMDAIDQVKVQSGLYQAEFGRKAGAAIQAVTKAGGLQYHGALYWYQRNNIFNALQSFTKTNHEIDPTKPLRDTAYRFITAGFNVGGPVYIPKLIPRGQQKLFFFFSEEQQREARPQDVRQVTVPTALERQGNFSLSAYNKTTNTYGPLAIADPQLIAQGKTCKKAGDAGCFANGIIPGNRIDPRMQAFLNLLPVANANLTQIGPNLVNAGGTNFNYQVQESLAIPKHTETLRVDFNPTQNNLLFVTLSRWWDDELGFAVPAGNANWGWLPSEYNPISRFLTIDAQHIFSPTFIFEGRLSASRWTEGNHPKQAIVNTRVRSLTGATMPQLYLGNNPLNLVSQANFGGVSNPANPTIASRYPITGIENVFTFDPVLTKVVGPHTAKTGMFIEYWQEHKGVNGDFTGTYDFSSNSSSYTAALGNTGNPYANALIGDFQKYTENNTRPPLISHYQGIEWFGQDNWKALPNLTLDLGVRLGWSRPFHNAPANEAGFVPELYNPAQRVLLYGMTGAPKPPNSALNGAIVPGIGNPVDGTVANGIVPGFEQAYAPNYPPGLRNSDHVKVAPRFGFSYDPFGTGKTAIRGGFGVFYDMRERDNFFTNDFKSVPLQFQPTIEFGDTTYTSSGAVAAFGTDTVNPNVVKGFTFPSSSFSFQRNRKVPYTMEYSLGIQREIGFKTVLDVAYVASMSRHLIWEMNQNAVPANATIANPSLPVNALRPYLGYADINQLQYSGTSNYNSLQVFLDRRFAKSVDFSAAYTWSKALDFADSETGTVLNPYIFNSVPFRQWQYGLADFDHNHIFRASWTWDIPQASHLWNHGFVHGLLDDWRISGITTFQTGAPLSISLNNVCLLPQSAGPLTPAMATSTCTNLGGTSNSGTSWSGSSTQAGRVLILGTGNVVNATTPFAHTNGLDGLILAPPMRGTLAGAPQGVAGFAPKSYFRGPGIDNWDMSLFKQIPMPTERLKLQFRAEVYNVFNHTNFTTVDTNAQFQVDYLGNFQQVNPTFGKYTAAALKRRMQLALRLSF